MKRIRPPSEGLNHVVEEGEWIGSIAKLYGFAKWETIWNRSENEQLRINREEDPFTLGKGDILFIPPFNNKKVIVKTGVTHTFKLKIPKTRLRIRVLDFDDDPLRNEEFDLEIHVPKCSEPILVKNKQTNQDGMVDEFIPAAAIRTKIIFTKLQYSLEARLSHLEPMDLKDQKKLILGAQQRLKAIGFDPGLVDGINGPLTKSAVRLFQKFCKDYSTTANPRVIDSGPVDGIVGPKTRKALMKYFGR